MLSGEKVILRACEPSDIDILLKWENDPHVWKVTGTLIPFSRHTLQRYLDTVHDLYADKQFRFIFTDKTNGDPKGMIDLFDYDAIHGRAGVGILVGDDQERSKGWGSDALQTLVRYCREHLDLKILYCHVLVDNEPSIRAFEKVGFIRQTTLKDWYKRGDQRVDEHLYILYL